MGVYLAHGNCISCGAFFPFNPLSVPSIRARVVPSVIKLRRQHGSFLAGSSHEVRSIVPHGGHSDSARQYVIGDDTYVTSDAAEVVSTKLVESPDAERQPVCRTCIERANPVRVKNGLPPIPILPDAYEPADESEAPLGE